METKIFAPVTGDIRELVKVPDEVFSQKMLGDGIAIDPKDNFVYAPFDGSVEVLPDTHHAIGLKTEDGSVEILIHIGVDTVNLKGQGFTVFVKEGDTIKKGQKLIEFDRDFLAKNAPSNTVIVIVTSDPELKITPTKEASVKPGDFLFGV